MSPQLRLWQDRECARCSGSMGKLRNWCPLLRSMGIQEKLKLLIIHGAVELKKTLGPLIYLSTQIFTHEEFPGSLQSQNNQPSTELRVIDAAAAEGDKNFFPFIIKALLITWA